MNKDNINNNNNNNDIHNNNLNDLTSPASPNQKASAALAAELNALDDAATEAIKAAAAHTKYVSALFNAISQTPCIVVDPYVETATLTNNLIYNMLNVFINTYRSYPTHCIVRTEHEYEFIRYGDANAPLSDRLNIYEELKNNILVILNLSEAILKIADVKNIIKPPKRNGVQKANPIIFFKINYDSMGNPIMNTIVGYY